MPIEIGGAWGMSLLGKVLPNPMKHLCFVWERNNPKLDKSLDIMKYFFPGY